MKKERNNVFVSGLNMEDKSSEVIAREAAMKIVEITDELMERKRIHENKIKAIADEADLIVNAKDFATCLQTHLLQQPGEGRNESKDATVFDGTFGDWCDDEYLHASWFG